ncbi:hypothetical protein GW915_06585 [bacterium]|nr:hypothetical protein [bacterium]
MAKKIEIHNFETVVVGSGPSGLIELSKIENLDNVCVLESEDRPLGRLAQGSLHLLKNPKTIAPDLSSSLIKWEREWVPASGFKFDARLWAQSVPQWQHYIGESFSFVSEPPVDEFQLEKIRFSSPVSEVQVAEDGWTLQSLDAVYNCKKLIWAAGLESFQNAYGKEAARDFQVPNPNYNADARETMGGIALNWSFAEKAPELNADLPVGNLMLLPVKHNKLYYLAVVTVERAKALHVKSLTYLPDDMLKQPKEILSYQKSLRRVLKSLFVESGDLKHREVMIQSSKLCGHGLGMPWVLADEKEGIRFVGDEALSAVSSSQTGISSFGEVDSSDEVDKAQTLCNNEPLSL